MSKKILFILGGIVLLFGVAQLFGPEAPEISAENPDDLLATQQISAEVSGLLRMACYDCHSMETRFPWYSSIMPVSGFIYHHIEEGREELNFSSWASMSKRDKLRKLNDIQEELEEGKMPLESYTKIHKDAILTAEQKEALITWAKEMSKQVIAQ